MSPSAPYPLLTLAHLPLRSLAQEGPGSYFQMVLHSEPTFEVEQDYFDWEMAVTGIADMEKEIRRLRSLV